MEQDGRAKDAEADKAFFDFCYDQYKVEMEDAERIYTRVGILITALVVLAGVVKHLARPELAGEWNLTLGVVPIATGILHIATMAAGFCLLKSLCYTLRAARPQKYTNLASTEQLREWKEIRALHIAQNEAKKSPGGLSSALWREMLPKLTEAQFKNAELNEKRRIQYEKALSWIVRAVVAILIQGFFAFFVYLGELTP
jgi:hypothetical protein